MRNICRRCCCMNNYSINNACTSQDGLETKCNCVNNQTEYNKTCNCGFDEEDSLFPENPMLANSYVPNQVLNETFKPCVGLKHGTIFPELVSSYNPGNSMEEINYLKRTNKIGEGCNS